MNILPLIGFAVLLLWLAGSDVPAQVIGDEAEMERLRSKAEEAIANGDADGAAMNSGKAALMAAQLAARQQAQEPGRYYRGAEALFRAQEHGYRALALFQRAGGQPPASSGVCGTMKLAEQAVTRAIALLGDDRTSRQEVQRLRAAAEDWSRTLEGLAGDFQCRE